MSLKNDEVASVDAEICIGCGNCVPICPTQSLVMERRSNKKPLLGDKVGVGLGF
jgi:Fe-S-cluster-containing hydrogenase component 2